MIDLHTAAKQALEALESYKGFIEDAHILEGQWHWIDGADSAITALRQALEQPAQQEPLFKPLIDLHPGLDAELKALEQPAQREPVKPPLWELLHAEKPAQQEPVAKVCHYLPGHIGWNPNLTDLTDLPDDGKYLYTRPQVNERFELIGHADLSINNIYIFDGYGEEVPEDRTPIYAGYKTAYGIGENK